MPPPDSPIPPPILIPIKGRSLPLSFLTTVLVPRSPIPLLSDEQLSWFAGDEKVRKALGLVEKPVVSYSKSKSKRIVCEICFDSYRSKAMRAAVCRHRYCSACWERYVSISVSDGAECLRLRYPEPSCRAAVGQDMISLVASKEDGERYSNYLLRSYVENYRKTMWCPAPGCEYAVLFDDDCNRSYDVVCKCSHDFCEEAHSLVACDIVAKWVVKNSS